MTPTASRRYPVEVHPAGLVLAAGAGRRLGRPKALVHLDGQALVTRACQVLADAGCAPVLVVLGAAADQVQDSIDLAGAFPVVAAGWQAGLAASLRTGLAGLTQHAPTARGAAILLVDTPGLGAAAVRATLAHLNSGRAAVACYGGHRGHPVVLGRDLWPLAAELATGEEGARALLRRHPDLVDEVDCTGLADPRDVDTAAELDTWRHHGSNDPGAMPTIEA